jgi:hypothetical protein
LGLDEDWARGSKVATVGEEIDKEDNWVHFDDLRSPLTVYSGRLLVSYSSGGLAFACIWDVGRQRRWLTSIRSCALYS